MKLVVATNWPEKEAPNVVEVLNRALYLGRFEGGELSLRCSTLACSSERLTINEFSQKGCETTDGTELPGVIVPWPRDEAAGQSCSQLAFLASIFSRSVGLFVHRRSFSAASTYSGWSSYSPPQMGRPRTATRSNPPLRSQQGKRQAVVAALS